MMALSLAGGSVDAATYLGLGHVFPAAQTGNTALMMIAVAQGSSLEFTRALDSLVAYCVGVAVGTAVLRQVDAWPNTGLWTLTFEALVLALLLAIWAAVGLGAHFGLIFAAACAMGAQSAAVRASHVRGVTTTYVTGTLTTTVARLVQRLRGAPEGTPASPALPGGTWTFYALGALAGALAVGSWGAGVIAIPLALVSASATAALWRRPRQER